MFNTRRTRVFVVYVGICLLLSAYEDEDLRDIRASMEQLLQEENDFMRNHLHDGRGDFNGNATVDEDKDFFNRIIVELEQQNDQMTVADDDDVEDGEDEDEECLNGSPVEEEAGELLSNGVREEAHTNKSQFNEEWQSGKRAFCRNSWQSS